MTETLDMSAALGLRVANADALALRIANVDVWTLPAPWSYWEDFESGAGGWTNRTVGFTVAQSSTQKRGGTYSLFCNTTSNGTRRAGVQLNSMTIGKTYNCEAWVRTTNSSQVNSFFLGVEGIGNGSEVDPATNTWALVTYSFVATATSHWLNITFTVTNTAQDCYIDDVYVAEV